MARQRRRRANLPRVLMLMGLCVAGGCSLRSVMPGKSAPPTNPLVTRLPATSDSGDDLADQRPSAEVRPVNYKRDAPILGWLAPRKTAANFADGEVIAVGELQQAEPVAIYEEHAAEGNAVEASVVEGTFYEELDFSDEDFHVNPQMDQVASTSAVPFAIAVGAPRTADQLPAEFQFMALDEAIQMAVANGDVVRELGGRVVASPDSAATAFDAAIRENDPVFGTHAALSAFDTTFGAQMLYDKNDRVFNNITLGGGAQELLQDLTTGQAQLQRTTTSGAQFALRTTTLHDRNNRQNNLFGHVWESQWEAEVRQPLLQGAGREFNMIAGPNARPGLNFSSGILIARLNTEISQADFETAVQQFVDDVTNAYWRLHIAYEGYESRRLAYQAAKRTWNTIQARFEQGLEGGEADKESQARAQMYLYEDLAREYLNGSDRVTGIYESERALRRLLGMPLNEGQLLRPNEPMPAAEVVFDWQSLIDHALSHRVELRRQEARIRQSQLRLTASRDFLFPRLDALARYRVRGLGDDLAGSGPRFASAAQDLANFDHQEWGFGLELDVPLGFRTARAGIRQAQLQLSRERAILADQQQEIARRLSDAVSRVAQTHASMHSALKRGEASRERVAATESAYESGRSSVDLVLDAQERYFEAQLRAAQARVDYATALKDTHLQSGQLLADIGVGFTESTLRR